MLLVILTPDYSEFEVIFGPFTLLIFEVLKMAIFFSRRQYWEKESMCNFYE